MCCISVVQAAAKDEEDFPRGGAHPLTPLEIREAKNEAEKDILFGVDMFLVLDRNWGFFSMKMAK